MPLTLEQKNEKLLHNGYDPTKYELGDDDVTVYEREDEPSFVPTTVSIPQQAPQKKMTAFEAVKTTAPRSIIPTLGGFGGAAVAAALAPQTGGLSLLLPILGSFGGGYAASKAQEKLLPPSAEEVARLQQARQDQPMATLAGEVLPSLIAMKPSLSTLSEAGTGLRQLSTLGSRALSPQQISALSNVGIGATIGGVGEAAGAALAGEDIDPRRVLGAMAANALITDPNTIGQRVFGFHPVVGRTPASPTIENTRDINLGDYRAPMPEGPQTPPGWRPMPESQQHAIDLAELDALYEQNLKNVAKSQAIQRNVEAKNMREYIDAQTKLAEEQNRAEIADINATAEMYRRMAMPYVGEEVVKPSISEGETIGKPLEFKRPSQQVAEAKPFVGDLVEPAQGLRAKVAAAPVEITNEPPRGLGSEVRIEEPTPTLREPANTPLPRGAGKQLRSTQELTARKGRALHAEGGSKLTAEELQKKGVELNPLLNQDTRKVAAALADRLGYTYQEGTGKIIDTNTGKEVPGQAFTEKLIADVNPTSPNRGPGERGFGLDTPAHELFHIFVEGLRKHGSAFEKRLVARGEELFGGNEPLVREGGKKSVFDLYDESHPIKQFMRLLWKHIKLRFGAGSKEDVRDWLIQRMMKAPPSEPIKFDAAGRAVPKTAEMGSDLASNQKPTYIGEQQRPDGTSFSLYNTPDGSTVTAETLKKLGYEVPERKVDLSSPEGQSRMAEMKQELGIKDAPVSAQDKKALANLPSQKLAKGGSDFAIAPFMTSQVNKVRKLGDTGEHVADKAERFFAKKSRYEGKFGETGAEIVQRANLRPEQDTLLRKWFYDMRHEGKSDIQIPKELTPLTEAIRKQLRGIADYATEKRVPVVTELGDVRSIKQNPNYFQDLLAPEVAHEWATNPTSPKSEQYKQLMTDFLVKNDTELKDLAPAEAQAEAAKIAQQYARAVGKSEAHDSASFAALRRAAGVGLPWELTEKSLEKSMFRYGRRAARDIAFWEEIQSDPAARYALGVRDEFEKLTPAEADTRLPSGSKVVPIDADKDVQALRRSIFGKQIQEMPRIQSAAKLVHSMIMQIPTGLRDIASIPVNALPYTGMGEGMRYSLKALGNVISDYKSAYSRARESGAVRHNLNDFVMGDPDTVKSNLNAMSNFFYKYSGRGLLEGAGRTFTYALGEEIAKSKFVAARSGDREAQQLLRRLGASVDNIDQYFGKNAPLPDKETITRVAKEFTDATQGGYDPRNLPTWAIEGSVAPFVSIQKWGIEKANVIYKDVIKPMKQGDYSKFIRYTLGGLLTGAAIEQLNQLINNSRGYDPTIAEVTQSDDSDAGEYAKKFVSLMQMAGYAGIVSDTAKLALAAGSGNYSKYNSPVNYPLYSYVTDTLAGNISDYVEAMKLGEDPFRTTARLINQLATQSLQNARMIRNYADADETKRKEMNRDFRVWQEMSGRAGAKMTPDYNRFVGVDEREFKNATDPEQISEMAQRLFERYLNEENPQKMAERFESLRRMPITWAPSLSEKPEDMTEFLRHIEDTQGQQSAQDTLSKYATQQQMNEAKKALVPKL